MVNEFLSSIFGKRSRPLPFVDFAYFNELIEDSLFYREFWRVIKTNLSELLTQTNT